MVTNGANLNAIASDGKTPLGLSVYNGNYELASFLIDSGSQIDLPDAEGFTPLFWAVDRRNMEWNAGFPWTVTADPLPLIRQLLEAGADVVGTNCGNGIEKMVEIAEKMRAVTDGYLAVHSNAGIPAIVQGRIVYPETPEFMAEGFKKLHDLGVNIIGGCCGTGPDHIRELSKTLRG